LAVAMAALQPLPPSPTAPRPRRLQQEQQSEACLEPPPRPPPPPQQQVVHGMPLLGQPRVKEPAAALTWQQILLQPKAQPTAVLPGSGLYSFPTLPAAISSSSQPLQAHLVPFQPMPFQSQPVTFQSQPVPFQSQPALFQAQPAVRADSNSQHSRGLGHLPKQCSAQASTQLPGAVPAAAAKGRKLRPHPGAAARRCKLACPRCGIYLPASCAEGPPHQRIPSPPEPLAPVEGLREGERLARALTLLVVRVYLRHPHLLRELLEVWGASEPASDGGGAPRGVRGGPGVADSVGRPAQPGSIATGSATAQALFQEHLWSRVCRGQVAVLDRLLGGVLLLDTEFFNWTKGSAPHCSAAPVELKQVAATSLSRMLLPRSHAARQSHINVFVKPRGAPRAPWTAAGSVCSPDPGNSVTTCADAVA
jgi:hypothetical protein